MKDVQKTQVKKTVHHKKRRRRRYKASGRFYVILVLLFVIVAGIILSRTVFFNISKFTLAGDSPYSLEEMLSAAGIKEGDNLFSMNFEYPEQKLLDTFPYIESVKMERNLPYTLKITVKKSEACMNITAEDGSFYVVSKSNRILEKGLTEAKEGIVTILGYEPKDIPVCKTLSSDDASKDKLVKEIIKSLDESELTATAIDITDKNIIYVNHTNNLRIKIGEPTDIEYKLELAKAIISQRGNPNEFGTINVESTEYPSFMANQ